MAHSITILRGDCTAVLPTLPAGSCDCCVTSPPYWGLRDYGIAPTEWPDVSYAPMPGLPAVTVPAQSACLGLETTPEAYVAHIVHVFRAVRRVLRDGATLWLNLGDSYSGNATSGSFESSGLKRDGRAEDSRARSIAHQWETREAERRPTKAANGIKQKDMIGIPWRVAFALQADGWWLRSDVVWAKPNPMPESVTDRPTKAHEYVFLLATGARYFYDADAVREAHISDGRGGFSNKETCKWTQAAGPGGAALASMTDATVNPLGRNKRSVWTIATVPFPGAHFAVWPPELARTCILAGCTEGGTVLEPFGGSGTTALVARSLGRRCVSIEASETFAEMQRERVAGTWRPDARPVEADPRQCSLFAAGEVA